MTVIGITGASGGLGRRTAQYVMRAHGAQDVALFSRTPDSLTEFATAGARVRQADFTEPESLTTHFSGVDVLLLISTDAVGHRIAQQEAAINAAVAAGVSRIVYTSSIGVDKTFPAAVRPLIDDHRATETALRNAAPSWTILRNALYLEIVSSGWAPAASMGRLVTNNGSGRHAPVARDDAAAAAAAALLGDRHDGAIYNITGQRLVDDTAIALALGDRHRRPVDVVSVEDRDYEEGLLSTGLPADAASLLTGFGAAIRTGLFEAPLGDTEALIGRSPLSVEKYLAAWPLQAAR